jgi:hypothetical protein
VAVFLGVVGAVACHEHIVDREADKVYCDPDLRGDADELRLRCYKPVWFEVIGKRIRRAKRCPLERCE